ncbi:MAG TPA: hypothetical protein VNL91_07515 [Thermoanaerobaculia bacterium]|nr:hypothetical protein [Thermoanaerobaculia bacterium]
MLDPAKTLATSQLTNLLECSALFEKYGRRGVDVIASTDYRNGESTSECQSNPLWGAWTRVGSSTVYLCDKFLTTSDDQRAINIIHEALHSAGIDEYPGDPNGLSSWQINEMIAAACQLYLGGQP